MPKDNVESTDGETRYFDGSVVKVDEDGNDVLSDHVGPGEKLSREVAAEKAEALLEEQTKVGAKRPVETRETVKEPVKEPAKVEHTKPAK